MTQARFAKLAVSAQFNLHAQPVDSIYDDLERQYAMDIFALEGKVEDDEEDEDGYGYNLIKVGSMKASLLRFDAALNLGQAPEMVADAHTRFALDLYEWLERDGERNPIGGGMHRDTVLLQSIDLRKDLQGTSVEHEAIRVALIGLSSGISRAFLNLGADLLDSPGELNEAMLRYAPIGFRPVEFGSNLLWIDIESADFWHI